MRNISEFFRRQPDALQVSDWLKNMVDAMLERLPELLGRDTSSPNMLVYFTLMSATASTDNILHNNPSVLSSLGAVYRELRAYYECLWQLVLLSKFGSVEEHKKISKLYGHVRFLTNRRIQDLFQQSPNLGRLLRCAFDDSYDKRLRLAVTEYVLGGHSAVTSSGDAIADNVEFLTMSILRASKLSQDHHSSIKCILSQDTKNALKLRVLTQFDINSSSFLELPDEFYQ